MPHSCAGLRKKHLYHRTKCVSSRRFWGENRCATHDRQVGIITHVKFHVTYDTIHVIGRRGKTTISLLGKEDNPVSTGKKRDVKEMCSALGIQVRKRNVYYRIARIVFTPDLLLCLNSQTILLPSCHKKKQVTALNWHGEPTFPCTSLNHACAYRDVCERFSKRNVRGKRSLAHAALAFLSDCCRKQFIVIT